MSQLITNYKTTNGADPLMNVEFITAFTGSQAVVTYVININGGSATESTTLTSTSNKGSVDFNNGAGTLKGTLQLEGKVVTFDGYLVWPGKLQTIFDKGIVAVNS
jgi:hypothetical protein